MASNNNDERWYFTKEQLDNTPSRQCGIEANKELSYRQQAANFIQDLGQRLKVSQLCINTAIVYMHRFYVFHSFTHFPWHLIASAALFLAAKVEEQPRKLEHVIRIANLCKNPNDTSFDPTSERYLAQSQDLVFNENVLLQTLGFDVAIDHPHTHVVKCCHLVRASKDLAQTSYFMASNSLHLTTMCLQYKPTVVACFCIHLACKWSNWEIPLSNEKKEWFSYVDPTVTVELLQQLTEEFLVIFERCPSRLKEKTKLSTDRSHNPSPPLDDEKRVANFISAEQKDLHHQSSKVEDPYKRSQKLSHDAGSSSQRDRDKEREYRERKERERLAGHSKYPIPPLGMTSSKHMPPPHGHHSHMTPADAKLKPHGRLPSSSHQNVNRIDSKNIPREVLMKEQHGRENKDVASVESTSRDIHKDVTLSHSDKDFHRREGVNQRQDAKSNIATDTNCDVNLNDSRVSFSSDKRPDVPRTSSRVSVDPKSQPSKHDFGRKREDIKPHSNLESDIKRHLNSEYFDKSNSIIENSQKLKSPLASEYNKKIANQNSTPVVKAELSSFSNVNKNSGFNSLPLLESTDPKHESQDKAVQLPVKKPSLFSPEKTPPKNHVKTSPLFNTSFADPSKFVKTQERESPKLSNSRRNRASSSSSGSEPELRPVIKKIDQVEGFENIMRDSSIGLKLQVPDIITPITERSDVHPSIAKDMKPPDLILPFSTTSTFTSSSNTSTSVITSSHTLVNGIETNPMLISNLLKETPTTSHLQTMTVPSQNVPLQQQPVVVAEEKEKDKEHHHKERKKSKKEKHKHKDKSKEEKEKKKKHKDKDKEKHKHKHENPPPTETVAQPIKITIPKDKIHPPETPTGSGLKIKIPKDRIKTESLENANQSGSGELKIRIPKGVINFNNDNKKREREKSSPSGGPPVKLMKSSHGRPNDPKQNGKNSYNKVSEMNRKPIISSSEQTRPSDAVINTAVPNSMPMYQEPVQGSNYFFNYPPPNMQLAPPHGIAIPPNFMYPPMYQQFYPGNFMFSPQPPLPPHTAPPLPQEPPPNKPPPPPE